MRTETCTSPFYQKRKRRYGVSAATDCRQQMILEVFPEVFSSNENVFLFGTPFRLYVRYSVDHARKQFRTPKVIAIVYDLIISKPIVVHADYF